MESETAAAKREREKKKQKQNAKTKQSDLYMFDEPIPKTVANRSAGARRRWR